MVLIYNHCNLRNGVPPRAIPSHLGNRYPVVKRKDTCPWYYTQTNDGCNAMLSQCMVALLQKLLCIIKLYSKEFNKHPKRFKVSKVSPSNQEVVECQGAFLTSKTLDIFSPVCWSSSLSPDSSCANICAPKYSLSCWLYRQSIFCARKTNSAYFSHSSEDVRGCVIQRRKNQHARYCKLRLRWTSKTLDKVSPWNSSIARSSAGCGHHHRDLPGDNFSPGTRKWCVHRSCPLNVQIAEFIVLWSWGRKGWLNVIN